jgi:hypothetical protein
MWACEGRTDESVGTYGCLPLFEDADEDDDVRDVAVLGRVQLVKVEGQRVIAERREGLVDAKGRGVFRVTFDDCTCSGQLSRGGMRAHWCARGTG